MRDELVEELADYVHDAWAGWMRYLFDKCYDVEGTMVLPTDYADALKRQMGLYYDDLNESEKEKDRIEARKILHIVEAHNETDDSVNVRHWVLYSPNRPIEHGVDLADGNRNTAWSGNTGEWYASGDTYGEAVRRLGEKLEEVGI